MSGKLLCVMLDQLKLRAGPVLDNDPFRNLKGFNLRSVCAQHTVELLTIAQIFL